MISLIICSRSSDISPALRDSIKSTIAVPYELIVIDNSSSAYSIFTAYNMGIDRAQGDILCFLHDDVLFISPGWGAHLQSGFVDSSLGAIGVAGTAYFPSLPIGWYATGVNAMNIIHASKPNNGPHVHKILNIPHIHTSMTPVVALDGVFLAISRNALAHLRFDSQNFSGFHGYDLDISFQLVSAGFKLAVTHSILLEHASIGNLNESWLRTMFAIHDKWQNVLPLEALKLSTLEKQRSVIRSSLILIGIELKSLFFCKYALRTFKILLHPKNRWAFTSWQAPIIGLEILLELSKIPKLLHKFRRPHLH